MPVIISVALCAASACRDAENSEDDPSTDSNSTRSQTVAKLNLIVFPEVPFEDYSPTLKEAIDYIRSKSIELDALEPDPPKKGIWFCHFNLQGFSQDGQEVGAEANLGLAPDDERWTTRLSFSAENIKLGDLITEVAARSNLDAYLTSQGVVFVPEGADPIPDGRGHVEIWQVLRKAP